MSAEMGAFDAVRQRRAEALVAEGDMRIEVVKREVNQGALAGFDSRITDYAAALIIVALDSFDRRPECPACGADGRFCCLYWSNSGTQADYVLDGSPEAVAIVRKARGLPALSVTHAAEVLSDVRCYGVHPERWDDGAAGVACAACKSWGTFYVTPVLAAAGMDVGTGDPDDPTLRRCPLGHRLDSYSDWCEDCAAGIGESDD